MPFGERLYAMAISYLSCLWGRQNPTRYVLGKARTPWLRRSSELLAFGVIRCDPLVGAVHQSPGVLGGRIALATYDGLQQPRCAHRLFGPRSIRA